MEIQQNCLPNVAAPCKTKRGSRKKIKGEPLPAPAQDSVEKGSMATRKVDIRDIAASMLQNLYTPPLSKEWSFSASESISNDPAFGADNSVVVSYGDTLRAMDRATGNKRWEFKANTRVGGGPAVGSDGTVFAGSSQKYLYAIDGKTGQEKWRFEIAVGGATSKPAVDKHDDVYFGNGNIIHGISGKNGAEKWSLDARGQVNATWLGPDETLYASCGAYRNDYYLHAIDIKTGKAKWSFMAGGNIGSLAAVGKDGTVYVGSDDWHVYALDGKTGKKKWSYKTGKDGEGFGSISGGPVTGPDGTVYAASDDRRLHAIDGKTGNGKWTVDLEDWARATPTFDSDGILYVSNGKTLFAIDPMKGEVKERFDAKRDFTNVWPRPAIDEKGAIIFISDKDVYSLLSFRKSEEVNREKMEQAKDALKEDKENAEQPQAPTVSHIDDDQGFIIIDGLKLEVNKQDTPAVGSTAPQVQQP